jgi:hypothetical protein
MSRFDVAQVVAACAFERQRFNFLLRGVRLAGTSIFTRPDRYLPVRESGMRHDFGRRAFSDDLAAVDASARADIHDVVGQADCIFVVLDDDYRVADIAQVLEGAEQAVVVALVQADGRFVEDVQHAHQAGADLAGQTNPLRLATRQRVSAAIQRQIIQTDVDQELQALADFLEDLVGDLAATTGQSSARRNSHTGIADWQIGHRRQSFLANPHVPRLHDADGCHGNPGTA